MLKATAILFVLFSFYASAQTPSLKAICKVDGHRTMLPSFELELTGMSAKIRPASDRDSDDVTKEFSGNLKTTSRPNSGKLVYFGFDDLFLEYSVTLSVPVRAFQESQFSARLAGRGEALIIEDYDCVVSN